MVMDRVQDILRQHKQKLMWETAEESVKRLPMTDKDKSYTVI
jgi:hypothetical protein